jgi:hypothetical protein
MGKLLSTLLKSFVPGVLKPLQSLWNEIIGFLFLVFAIVCGASVVRTYLNFDGSFDSTLRLVFMGIATLLMGFFAAQSFLKARRIARSNPQQ